MGYIESLKQRTRELFGLFGLSICNKSSFEKLLASHENSLRFNILSRLLSACDDPKKKLRLIEALGKSKAQLYQDIVALFLLEFKSNGFFVEFGATNGVDISNTYLLEKSYNWKGILAEPAKIWHNDLYANRSSFIDTRCVSTKSNEVVTLKETNNPEFSSTGGQSRSPLLEDTKFTQRYQVETVSLTDLLAKYSAPKVVDFLSLDTEGSELDILRALDFERFKFQFIACEHNFQSKLMQFFHPDMISHRNSCICQRRW